MKNSIPTKSMPREEWLKHRWRIGSSDVSAILGLNMWKSPLNVYEEKVALLDGRSLPDIDNEQMLWGRLIEDVIAKRFSARTGFKVKRDNRIRVHPDYPFLACNLDRLYKDGSRGWGICEIKSAGDFAASNWNTEIPLPYWSQVTHQMCVSGIGWGTIPLQISNRELRLFPFELDQDFAKKQLAALVSFWENNVQKRIPPEWTQLDLDVIYAQPGTSIEANPEVLVWFNEAKSLYLDFKEKERQFKTLKNQICLYMKEADILTVDGATVATWKQGRPFKKLDIKKLKESEPDIADKYSVEVPSSRKFLIRGIKELKEEGND